MHRRQVLELIEPGSRSEPGISEASGRRGRGALNEIARPWSIDLRTVVLVWLSAAVALAGCTGPTIVGEVESQFGQPVEGVSVSIKNSVLATETDRDGHFELEYPLGSFVVEFTKRDMDPLSVELSLTSKQRYEIPKQHVVELPSARNGFIRIAADHEYINLPAVPLAESPVMGKVSTFGGVRDTPCKLYRSRHPLNITQQDEFLAFLMPSASFAITDAVGRREVKQVTFNESATAGGKVPVRLIRVGADGAVASVPAKRADARCPVPIQPVEMRYVPDSSRPGRLRVTGELDPGHYCFVNYVSGWTGISQFTPEAFCFTWKSPVQAPSPKGISDEGGSTEEVAPEDDLGGDVSVARSINSSAFNDRSVVSFDCSAQALSGATKAELRLKRNEVFARHGRSFRSEDLQEFFGAQDWYRPQDDYSDERLLPGDRECVELILSLSK